MTGTVVLPPTGALGGTVPLKVSCAQLVRSVLLLITVVWEARGKPGHVLAVQTHGNMVSTLWEMLL